MTKTLPPIPVISTEAKRSGEISPSHGTGSITAGDLSAQSIRGSGSCLSPIGTCSSARDDGGRGHPYRHFQKGTNDKNAAPIPVISTVAERSGEISRLHGQESIEEGDLSTQRIIGAIPICLPCRHAAPLEMTML